MVVSDDKKLTLWAGTIDDLWELGKPVGSGGPWVDAQIEADEYSDPYLIGFYDERILNISHKSLQPILRPVSHSYTISLQLSRHAGLDSGQIVNVLQRHGSNINKMEIQ